MANDNKLDILKSILDWSQAIKQKSIDLNTLFVLEYAEEIEKSCILECESIANSLFALCCILNNIAEDCKIVEYYFDKK